MERSTANILSLVTSLLTFVFFGQSYWASRPNEAKRRMDAMTTPPSLRCLA